MRLHSTLVAVWLTLSASAAIAQINTGEISGVVRDTSGGVLPGATVTARHDATGTVVERVTDGDPTSAVSGIGRGDENARTNWLHLYAQDDWQPRNNLTLNLGLRYEFNQHMYAVDNRLSSIDLEGRRFVIASDDNGAINPDSGVLLDEIPLPYVTSQAAGWGRGLLDPSAVRLAPRLGFALALNDSRAVIRGGYGIFLNQWAYSVQTAFARNLPFFFTKQIDVPSDVRVPTMPTRDILTSNATGTVGGSIMDYDYSVEYSQTWSGGLQYQIFNLLNRANFDLPNRIFGNPNFGRIFSAKGPREMQFGLRFAF